jgi:hypothetical protein
MLCIPGVDAGQVDVLPTQRRDVLQQRLGNVPARHFQVCDRAVKLLLYSAAFTTQTNSLAL